MKRGWRECLLWRETAKFFFFFRVSLLGLCFSKARSERLPTFSFISLGLVLRHWVALTPHHRMQPLIVPYVSLSFSFHVNALDFSPSPHHHPRCCLLYWSFPAARLLSPPKQQHGSSLLQSSSLDSPWITWEKELLCLPLLSIIASATPTTGFICWRRVTFDTGASQAGLPLSPAHALFLAAEGAERVFNEIQTLGMRSHRHLRTLLPLTSVAMCAEIKKTWAKLHGGMLLRSVNAQWWWETMGGLGENQGFLKDSNIPASSGSYRSISAGNDEQFVWKLFKRDKRGIK